MGTKQETGVDRKRPTDGTEIKRDGIEERGGTSAVPFRRNYSSASVERNPSTSLLNLFFKYLLVPGSRGR